MLYINYGGRILSRARHLFHVEKGDCMDNTVHVADVELDADFATFDASIYYRRVDMGEPGMGFELVKVIANGLDITSLVNFEHMINLAAEHHEELRLH